MRAWMLSMAIGIGLIAELSRLPPLWFCLTLALIPLAAWPWRRSAIYLSIFAFIIGLWWGSAYGWLISRELLPLELEQQPLWVTGRIDSLVESTAGFRGLPSLRWQLSVESCRRPSGADCAIALRNILLAAYDTDLQPSGGELWQLRVVLKRPRGFANPAGFDYEAWLVAQRIGAVGYVEAGSFNRRIAAAPLGSVEHWRSALKTYLDRRLQSLQHADLLLGLLIGDGSAIEQHSWNTFRATGTVHLFVVSGLQIAFTGGVVLWFGRLWWRSPWGSNRRYAYWLGIAPALLSATLYALLAGFGLPIQRALIMFAIVVWALATRREIGADAWVFALWLVMLSNPLAVLDAGFWFSFSAVAVILICVYGVRSAHPERWLWWRVQCALFAASLPVLLVLTGQFTWLALPANVLAVPWSTVITMPLAFAALLIDGIAPTWGAPLWQLADISLQWLWRYLCWLEQWSAITIWRPAGFGAVALVCAIVFALLMLLPRGTPGRSWALLFLLPLIWPPLARIEPGDCVVTVIDVGQGLSVLVQTARHNVLYDSGPPFGPERSVAELTVVPLLRRLGIETLDTVVISHKDNDHAGGWPTIAAQFTVARSLVGERLTSEGQPISVNAAVERSTNAPLRKYFAPSSVIPTAIFCRDQMHWRWDAVDFEILHPRAEVIVAGNNRSCVLQIVASGVVILLPGDIERAAEDELLARARLGRATILIAPHHGSRTSSSLAFIEQLQPRYVVFSTGYRNRFHHPSPLVVERYRRRDAQLFDTASDGAISFVVRHGQVIQVTQQRQLSKHYWQ